MTEPVGVCVVQPLISVPSLALALVQRSMSRRANTTNPLRISQRSDDSMHVSYGIPYAEPYRLCPTPNAGTELRTSNGAKFGIYSGSTWASG